MFTKEDLKTMKFPKGIRRGNFMGYGCENCNMIKMNTQRALLHNCKEEKKKYRNIL